MKTVEIIEVANFNELVSKTYKRPYHFQQQEGCRGRGAFNLTVPSDCTGEEEMNNEIPEKINGETMGVKFNKWLERDPTTKVKGEPDNRYLSLFWYRNFYPDINTLANDLHKKGLMASGDYIIDIDW